MENYFVFGFGHALIDVEYAVSDATLKTLSLNKGHRIDLTDSTLHLLQQQLTEAPQKTSCGGSAANTLSMLAMLGSNTFFYGKVNDDKWGHDYLSQLKQQNVSTAPSFISKSPYQTGQCIVFVTPDGERTMCTYLGAATNILFEHISTDILNKCDYFFIESYAIGHEQTFKAAVSLKKFGCHQNKKIALSLSDPDLVLAFHDRTNTLLADEKVDLIFGNEQEALNIAKTFVLSDAIEFLKTKSKQFAITRGSRGAIIFDGNTVLDIPAAKAHALDVLGAGDAFAAGVLFGLSKKLSFVEATQFGHRVAAQVISQFGPRLTKQQAQQLADSL